MLAEYEPYIIAVVIMLCTAGIVYITAFLIIVTHIRYEEKATNIQSLIESINLYKREVENLNNQIDKVIESNQVYMQMALNELKGDTDGK